MGTGVGGGIIIDGKSIWVIGNGGSASTAEHLEIDMMYIKHDTVEKVKVTALTSNSAVITAIANDKGYDVLVFDTPIDSHFINHMEQKLEKTQIKRVDSENVNKLIEKDENKELINEKYPELNEESEYLDERRLMMQEWSNYLDKLQNKTSTEKKMFMPDRFIEAQCHSCGAEGQYGEKCIYCNASSSEFQKYLF